MASRLVVGDQTARALCEVALLLVRSAVPLWAVLTYFLCIRPTRNRIPQRAAGRRTPPNLPYTPLANTP